MLSALAIDVFLLAMATFALLYSYILHLLPSLSLFVGPWLIDGHNHFIAHIIPSLDFAASLRF